MAIFGFPLSYASWALLQVTQYDVNIQRIFTVLLNAVKKISIIHESVARAKMLISSQNEMKYILYLLKKVNFLFILYSMEIQKAQPNFFLGRLDIKFGVNILCT